MNSEETKDLIDELLVETHGKLDGGRKNIIADCPWCGKHQKYGIYIRPSQGKKIQFSSHCFSCGRSTIKLNDLLDLLGRPDLKPVEQVTTSLEDWQNDANIFEEEEIDDSLVEIKMPEGYKRTTKNQYLRKRGFKEKDYSYFPVGTTRGLNWKFDQYVLFEIIDDGRLVGYVGRHTWSKDEIDTYNQKQKISGGYEIRRYNNSNGPGSNEFAKLLYNYDNVIEGETDTVILCEGAFDAIALVRKLNLYDNHRIVPVATWGKKISETQALKLQNKGVRTIVIGYDTDAHDAIVKAADFLEDYFDVYIARLSDDTGKDWDEMDYWDIFDVFSCNLLTPFEFRNVL